MPLKHTISAIGTVHSPYKEKFAIPRQPGLVTAAKGYIELDDKLSAVDMVEGLAEFSHIWVLFVFHQTITHGWKAKVKPPRLGGNQKLGVLATRSTFRPNGIGMSAVKLDQIDITNNKVKLHISGLDLLDQTPVVDIKPYIGYSDAINNVHCGFADAAPEHTLTVLFSEQAQRVLDECPSELTLLIEQVLTQDPRPAYRQGKPDDKTYGMRLCEYNITWQFVSLTRLNVLAITKI